MAWQTRRVPPEERCDDAAKARARALEYLAAREHSSGELYERLCRCFTEQAAAQAVAEMVERAYVDDARYAQAKAHSLLCVRKSRRAAAQVLRQKGVSPQDAAAALEEVYAPEEGGTDPEVEAARALVERRYQRKLADGRRDLVVAALARRGFSYPVIRAALCAAEQQE